MRSQRTGGLVALDEVDKNAYILKAGTVAVSPSFASWTIAADSSARPDASSAIDSLSEPVPRHHETSPRSSEPWPMLARHAREVIGLFRWMRGTRIRVRGVDR